MELKIEKAMAMNALIHEKVAAQWRGSPRKAEKDKEERSNEADVRSIQRSKDPGLTERLLPL